MDGKSRRYAMIPAFGMVILPQYPSTGMGMFQAGVAFSAVKDDILIEPPARTRVSARLKRVRNTVHPGEQYRYQNHVLYGYLDTSRATTFART